MRAGGSCVGRERVLLGFPGAGGMRADGALRVYVAPRATQPTTIGELDGTITPRLRQFAEMFEQAGFAVALSRNMDAWLKTHVALVSPIADALYLAGGGPAHSQRVYRTHRMLEWLDKASIRGGGSADYGKLRRSRFGWRGDP